MGKWLMYLTMNEEEFNDQHKMRKFLWLAQKLDAIELLNDLGMMFVLI
jgi:hypothetical protein